MISSKWKNSHRWNSHWCIRSFRRESARDCRRLKGNKRYWLIHCYWLIVLFDKVGLGPTGKDVHESILFHVLFTFDHWLSLGIVESSRLSEHLKVRRFGEWRFFSLYVYSFTKPDPLRSTANLKFVQKYGVLFTVILLHSIDKVDDFDVSKFIKVVDKVIMIDSWKTLLKMINCRWTIIVWFAHVSYDSALSAIASVTSCSEGIAMWLGRWLNS